MSAITVLEAALE